MSWVVGGKPAFLWVGCSEFHPREKWATVGFDDDDDDDSLATSPDRKRKGKRGVGGRNILVRRSCAVMDGRCWGTAAACHRPTAVTGRSPACSPAKRETIQGRLR